MGMKLPFNKTLGNEELVSGDLYSALFWTNPIMKLYILIVSIGSLVPMGPVLTSSTWSKKSFDKWPQTTSVVPL